MANRFKGKSCVLCNTESVGVGEHVWPSWFIREFQGEGPFYTEKNGHRLVTSKGLPQKMEAVAGAHVPMCEPCNSRLSSTIENTAKDIVRRLVPWKEGHTWPLLSPEEGEVLARWFLKVALLTAHPDVIHDNPRVNGDPSRKLFASMEPEWLNWMYEGGVPPDEFSVYLTRRAVREEEQYTGEQILFCLPDLSVDGRDLHYMSRSLGVRGLEVTIVWHPGWPIVHPLVDDGRAARLWPRPVAIDVGRLPEVHSKEFRFYQGAAGELHVTKEQFKHISLKPLLHDSDPVLTLFGDDLG